MKVGDYRLELVRPDGRPFHQLRDTEGNFYVVAVPGDAFNVQLSRSSASSSTRHPKKGNVPVHLAYLKVDGRDVGIKKKFSRGSQTLTFLGFLSHGDLNTTTYESFVFAKPAVSEDDNQTSPDSQTGRITVQVYQGISAGRRHSDYCAVASSTSQPLRSIPSLPDGKKFFLAPSLTTTGGQVTHGSGFSSEKYVKDPSHPQAVASLTLRYETPTTLLLRKILSPSNPAHVKVLDAFEETRSQSLPHQQGNMNANVKEEPHEVINLLQPNVQDASEDWECDLTREEDPRWRKLPKRTDYVTL